jgi:cyclophilin family peptidyl-prolyl cis-trans isomerase
VLAWRLVAIIYVSSADTTTSHFSILQAPAPHLNGKYTIFGALWPTTHLGVCARLSVSTAKVLLLTWCTVHAGELVEGWEVAAKVNALSIGKQDNTAGREAGARIFDAGQLRQGAPIKLPPAWQQKLDRNAKTVAASTQ